MSDETTGDSATPDGATRLDAVAPAGEDRGAIEGNAPRDDAAVVAATEAAHVAAAREDTAPADVVENPERTEDVGDAASADAADDAGAAETEREAIHGHDPSAVEEPGDLESTALPASVEAETSSTPVKAARTKVDGEANGSGATGERKADGSKSPKKAKKKSGKKKSHGDGPGGSAKTPPSASPSEEASAHTVIEPPAADPRGRVRRLLARNYLALILGVVAIGLAVALALTMLQIDDSNTLDGARASAVTAARTYSLDLAGYDYRHLDQDFGVVLSHSTTSFRRSFTQSSNALKSTLLKYHASAKATVVAAGLISATTTRAVALVFLDQTVTNSTQKAPTTDRSQVEITLVLTGGTWLIDQVSLL